MCEENRFDESELGAHARRVEEEKREREVDGSQKIGTRNGEEEEEADEDLVQEEQTEVLDLFMTRSAQRHVLPERILFRGVVSIVLLGREGGAEQ